MAALGLLALAACGRGDPPHTPPDEGGGSGASAPPLLREITAECGIDFVHHVESGGAYRMAELLGGGCAVFDADGDGLLDLYFVDTGSAPGSGARNRFFRRTPAGRYEDATDRSGLGDEGFGLGVAVGDVDNDGDLDVYVGNWGADRLLRNDGSGRFEDVTERAGLRGALLTSSVAFLDFDLDGFLDIFVLHHVAPDPHVVCGGRGAGRDFCGPGAYRHVPDTLYRNRGDGTFEDVSARSGVGSLAAPGLGIAVADFDGDSWPDVYVANDTVANHLWINQRDGTFRNDAIALGVAFNAQAAAEASMGVVVADVDQDGTLDIVCSHMAGETNTVYLRRSERAFVDASAATAVGGPSVPYTGWGMALFDVEHDGDLDLAVVNGAAVRGPRYDAGPVTAFWRDYAEPNQFLTNCGGAHFGDTSAAAGAFSVAAEVSRGLAAADLDGDGDVDLVVTNIAGPARVYENVAPKRGHWLRVRAMDPELRRDVYGAAVALGGGHGRHCRIIGPASSYLSSSDVAVHFGLALDEHVEWADVQWPGGAVERFPVAGLDRDVTLVKGSGE